MKLVSGSVEESGKGVGRTLGRWWKEIRSQVSVIRGRTKVGLKTHCKQ